MTYDQDDVQNVALCSWKEARGDGIAACYYVMHVIVNRVGKPGFAHTVHDVIYGKNQFSSMSIPTDLEYNLQPPATDPVWIACLADAPNVLGGDDDPTKGAIWYANPKTATSGWFATNIAGNPVLHPVLCTIGHHVFYA